MLTISKCVA